jgi:hypothetical protein
MNILMYPIAEDGTVILIKEPVGKICFITANFEALQLKCRAQAPNLIGMRLSAVRHGYFKSDSIVLSKSLTVVGPKPII